MYDQTIHACYFLMQAQSKIYSRAALAQLRKQVARIAEHDCVPSTKSLATLEEPAQKHNNTWEKKKIYLHEQYFNHGDSLIVFVVNYPAISNCPEESARKKR